ncbi:helix-turn-helix domain-containing protein, partial [Bradyrhizobium sp. SZCCHNR3111]
WVERQIERFSIPEMKKLWFSISDRPSAISVHTIQRVVCDHYRMRMSDMQSSRRMRGLVRPRQVAMYLCRILTSKSLPEIGRRFGGRDHTTILHAIKQIEAFKITDPDIAADVQHLTNLLEEKANEAATVASHRIASSQDEACGSDR